MLELYVSKTLKYANGNIFVRHNEETRHLVKTEADIGKLGDVGEAKKKLEEMRATQAQAASR